MKGADQCPKCGSRRTFDVVQTGKLYAGVIRQCENPACLATWEPFDPADLLDLDDPKTSSFKEPCGNCAFRPGSPEQADPKVWADILKNCGFGKANFYCHKGVPIDPTAPDGFAYPRDRDGKPIPKKLRFCRGYLRMWGTQADKARDDAKG